MNTPYGYTIKIDMSYEEAVRTTKEELQKEGFGILTEIDVKSTLKKKLDFDFDNYVILGACHPPSALKALQAEKEIGLLLPCNVLVFEDNQEVYISAIRPTVAMKELNVDGLVDLAYDIEKKIQSVINNIKSL